MPRQRAIKQSNDTFGPGSPSWNLPFPDGNITLPELSAYHPFGLLKSVDAIHRFHLSGGRAVILEKMLGEFRNKSVDKNSLFVMQKHSMKGFGFLGWTARTHTDWPPINQLVEGDLSVNGFRTCGSTHLSGNARINGNAKSIQFVDLANNVKKHPTGFDALDLTRCVKYAVAHPNESWLYPEDFGRLVMHLGGPATVTVDHSDRAAMVRYAQNLRQMPRTIDLHATPIYPLPPHIFTTTPVPAPAYLSLFPPAPAQASLPETAPALSQALLPTNSLVSVQPALPTTLPTLSLAVLFPTFSVPAQAHQFTSAPAPALAPLSTSGGSINSTLQSLTSTSSTLNKRKRMAEHDDQSDKKRSSRFHDRLAKQQELDFANMARAWFGSNFKYAHY